MLSFEQIKELIGLVSDHRLQGIEIERSGFRLKIEGREAARPVATPPEDVPAVIEPPTESVVEAAAPAEPAKSRSDNAHILKSPIVGTFYAAASPDADPYTGMGERVKKGQVLCIVEAMKLMNEIESDVDGEIVEIFPQNGQPVEFGEPLFAIAAG